jgi:hypothetical protein
MEREVSNRCVNCGFGFLFGPVFTDFIGIIRRQGFHRTYNFDYRLYSTMFGYQSEHEWPREVAFADCDSMFLGCVVDPNLKCPRCGAFAFPERSTEL